MEDKGLIASEPAPVPAETIASEPAPIPEEDFAATSTFVLADPREDILEILVEIANETVSQDEKWGPQRHPSGTDTNYWTPGANAAKRVNERAAETGSLTWREILTEEVYEAFAEEDPALLRAELIQSAAVIAQWVADLDRRAALSA
jgi:hypothetical protein